MWTPLPFPSSDKMLYFWWMYAIWKRYSIIAFIKTILTITNVRLTIIVQYLLIVSLDLKTYNYHFNDIKIPN